MLLFTKRCSQRNVVKYAVHSFYTKVTYTEDLSQVIYPTRSFHSFKDISYSLHLKLLLNHKRPFLIHLAKFKLLSIITLKGMKSTMMKLKMKMEKEEKEE